MKHILFSAVVLSFTLGLLFTTQSAFAAAILYQPTGGFVVSSVTPGVVCATGVGPLSQKSSNLSPTTPYLYLFGAKTPPSTGRWVLGLYNPIMDVASCVTAAGTPYPVFQMHPTIWGTSGALKKK